jgi:hypothetical protein
MWDWGNSCRNPIENDDENPTSMSMRKLGFELLDFSVFFLRRHDFLACELEEFLECWKAVCI